MITSLITVALTNIIFADANPKMITKSYQLGQVVKLFVRKDLAALKWDYLSEPNSPIKWKTAGIDETATDNGYEYSRTGIIGITVDGKFATKLTKTKDPIKWSVIYSTKQNPKYGVESVIIRPEVNPELCFGTLYDGCEFEIENELRNNGLTATMLCEKKNHGIKIKVYKASSSNASAIIWLTTSYGSGGSTSEIVVPPQAEANTCLSTNISEQSDNSVLDTSELLDWEIEMYKKKQNTVR